MSTDFNWADGNTVVWSTTYGVAVYANTDGDAVLRQEGGDDEDTVIVVPLDRLDDLIVALQHLKS